MQNAQREPQNKCLSLVVMLQLLPFLVFVRVKTQFKSTSTSTFKQSFVRSCIHTHSYIHTYKYFLGWACINVCQVLCRAGNWALSPANTKFIYVHTAYSVHVHILYFVHTYVVVLSMHSLLMQHSIHFRQVIKIFYLTNKATPSFSSSEKWQKITPIWIGRKINQYNF